MSNEKAPIPEERAVVAVQRLINSHFGQPNAARSSIPAHQDDDDLVAMAYIEQASQRIAALTAEVDALKKENFILDDVLTQQTDRIAELKAELARLSAPVNMKEWIEYSFTVEGTLVAIRDDVNALILARATPPQDVEKRVGFPRDKTDEWEARQDVEKS